jgi:phospholipid N-methyltransferase
MVESAALAPGHVVVELGAGTGPMTEEILRVRPHGPFVALEPNPTLAALLRQRFPGVRVDERKAQDLVTVLRELGWGKVDRVVSSLPFAIWPDRLQQEVFDGILAAMAPHSRFVTFGYAHARPLPAARRLWATLHERFSEVATTRIVWRNLPPALVYCCAGPKLRADPTLDLAEKGGGISP